MKLIILIFSLLLISCANFKYPGWEQVKIDESVFNKNCTFKNEEVNKCTDTNWFKKRATKFQANTVVLVPSKAKANFCLAGYFYCDANQSRVTFNKSDYVSHLKQGLNKVTGQAFLRQKGGDIVTCAGETVTLHPNTDYFNYVYSISEHYIKHRQLENEISLVKQTKCDAQGDFEFYNIPEGEWVIKTTVEWGIFWVEGVYTPPIIVGDVYLPSTYRKYSVHSQQGGILALDIVVKDYEPNKFIIAE